MHVCDSLISLLGQREKRLIEHINPPLLLTCPIFLVVNLFLNQHMMTFSGCLRLHTYLYVGIHQIIIWNCFVWDLLQRIQQIGCLLSINNLFITPLHMMTSFSLLLYTWIIQLVIGIKGWFKIIYYMIKILLWQQLHVILTFLTMKTLSNFSPS